MIFCSRNKLEKRKTRSLTINRIQSSDPKDTIQTFLEQIETYLLGETKWGFLLLLSLALYLKTKTLIENQSNTLTFYGHKNYDDWFEPCLMGIMWKLYVWPDGSRWQFCFGSPFKLIPFLIWMSIYIDIYVCVWSVYVKKFFVGIFPINQTEHRSTIHCQINKWIGLDVWIQLVEIFIFIEW